MTDKDLSVGAVGSLSIPTGPPNKMVPSYLVKLVPDLGAKQKSYRMFIAIEQPQFNADFIHAKGFFSESSEDDIVVGYKDMVASVTSNQIVEIWLPWHTIHSVRSLVFKTASKK